MFGEHAVMSHESLSKSLSKVPEVTLEPVNYFV